MPRVHRGALLSFTFSLVASLGLPAVAHADPAAGDSLAAYPPPRVRAWQVGLVRPDRLQHASLSFVLAAGATLATRRPAASFAGVLALGLAKEAWDSRAEGFDAVDLAADAAGATLGVVAARDR
ncbi:MAG: hypothetical protein IT347_00490 [Candidatus Eisenbacteria bacterium]|nr:hypothetical protein [Candidatus Eisenbacteria bacterium]